MKIRNNQREDRAAKGPAQPVDRIPVFLSEPLDPATMTVPRGALGRHLALSAKLQAQRPQVLSPEQARRLEDLARASALVGRTLEASRRKRPPDLAQVRAEAVSISGTITAALRLFASSRVPETARRATALRQALLPPGVMLTRLTPEELWVELDTMRATLTKDPELFATLLRVVPEEAVTSMFEVTDRLGQAAGTKDAWEVVAPVERARAHEYLVRTMNAYLRSVAAAVHDDDAASLDVGRAALAPVAEFRAANARRKTRGAAAKGIEEEKLDADEDGADGEAAAAGARGVTEAAARARSVAEASGAPGVREAAGAVRAPGAPEPPGADGAPRSPRARVALRDPRGRRPRARAWLGRRRRAGP